MQAARRYHPPLLAAALIVALLAIACANKAVAPEHTQTTPTTPTGALTVGIVVVEDGITLTGRLFGSQYEDVVILSHMRPNDQTAWFAFAQELERNGYAALTFNFRGYGDSQGEEDFAKLDEDLAAAIRYMRDVGKRRIFLVGASMGATTSLVVAAQQDVDGVVAISPPATFEDQDALVAVASESTPKLFIASAEDAPALSFDELVSAAAEPKEEVLYAGNAHGTALFETAHAAALRDRILGFLREHGGP